MQITVNRVNLVPSEERKSFMTNGGIRLVKKLNGHTFGFFINALSKDGKPVIDASTGKPIDLKDYVGSLVIQDQEARDAEYRASQEDGAGTNDGSRPETTTEKNEAPADNKEGKAPGPF